MQTCSRKIQNPHSTVILLYLLLHLHIISTSSLSINQNSVSPSSSSSPSPPENSDHTDPYNHHPPAAPPPPQTPSSSAAATNQKQQRCQEITIPMCKTIRYNYTEMPNSFNHETQEEAGLEVHQYWPLVEIKCSSDLKFFICSLYVPICMEDYTGTVPPCRSVCERARAGCEPVMTQYGFFWPERMSCEQFPKFGKHSICMDEKGGELPSQTAITATNINNNNQHVSSTPKKTSSSSSILKSSVYHQRNSNNDNKQSSNCNKKPNTCTCTYPLVPIPTPTYYSNSTTPAATIITTGNTKNCALPCRGYGYSSTEEIRFAKYWLTFWSSLTTSLSTLTVLTFLINPTRFNYPERPIILISFCYIFVSSGYLLRIYTGHSQTACGSPTSPIIRYPYSPFFTSTVTTTLPHYSQLPITSSPSCTLTFLLTYYFTLAASSWYVILTATWYLASVLKWSTESIASKSPLFHTLVWTSSALLTLSILLTDSIDGDSTSGICSVGNQSPRNLLLFVLVPLGLLLLVGSIFLTTGFISLLRIRPILIAHREVRNFHKLEKLMIRIGVFGVLYTLNVACVLAGHIYEAYLREAWVAALNCPTATSITSSTEICNTTTSATEELSNPETIIPSWTSHHLSSSLPPSQLKPAYSFLMIKYFMSLATGLTASIWVISSKTIETWKSFLGSAFKSFLHHLFPSSCCKKACTTASTSQPNNHLHPAGATTNTATTSSTSSQKNQQALHQQQHYHPNHHHHHLHHHLLHHHVANSTSNSILPSNNKQTHV